MVDAIAADQIRPLAGGVRAMTGSIVWAVLTSERDAHNLEEANLPAIIFTELETSEDTISLVGFANEERRDLYRALRQINGIGRRSALMVLDCGEVRDVLRAVVAKEDEFFRHVPGLGKKRIELLIGQLSRAYQGALPRELKISVAVWVEARDGLLSLGIDESAAELFLERAAESDPSSSAEELVNRFHAEN
jgi:Holliday junction resolvasome RuvABC DNA-binding subunit